MSIINTGKVAAFSMLLLMWVLAIYYYYQAKAGKLYSLRRIAAIGGIKEAVDRATEMGRPVHYTPGDKGLTNVSTAPAVVASLSILKYVAEMCAQSGTRLVVSVCFSDLIPLVEESMRGAYTRAGKPELYDPDDVVWFGNEQHSYTTGVQALMYRENIGANLMIGTMASESVIMPEVAARVGAMQVAGTAGGGATVANWAIACDYFFMADELFVAAAEITQDPVLVNNIRVSDVMKLLLVVVAGIGSIVLTAGYTGFLDFLKM